MNQLQNVVHLSVDEQKVLFEIMKTDQQKHCSSSQSPRTYSERGHGLFELLLCLPLMLLIIFGGIDVMQYLHNVQVAQTFAREGANEARRVCVRHVPEPYLDHFCMDRFLDSVEGTLANSRMMVSLYRIGESGSVELVDFVASYEDADIEESEVNPERLEEEFKMVQYAMDLRDDEEYEQLVPQDEFLIAVSEIWYEHEYFSRFTFSSETGYQLSVY